MIATTRYAPVAKQPEHPTRERIDLRADSALIARIRVQAERLGISLSDYIRMATTRQLERDEAGDPSGS